MAWFAYKYLRNQYLKLLSLCQLWLRRKYSWLIKTWLQLANYFDRTKSNLRSKLWTFTLKAWSPLQMFKNLSIIGQLSKFFIQYQASRSSKFKIKSSLYSRYYTQARNEWRGPLPRLSAWEFWKTSQRWRAVGDTVPDLTCPEIEPKTSRAYSGIATTAPTSRYQWVICNSIFDSEFLGLEPGVGSYFAELFFALNLWVYVAWATILWAWL